MRRNGGNRAALATGALSHQPGRVCVTLLRYRPGKSVLDAVRTARQRCWRYDWVAPVRFGAARRKVRAVLRPTMVAGSGVQASLAG
jgi:hypothetical protein